MWSWHPLQREWGHICLVPKAPVHGGGVQRRLAKRSLELSLHTHTHTCTCIHTQAYTCRHTGTHALTRHTHTHAHTDTQGHHHNSHSCTHTDTHSHTWSTLKDAGDGQTRQPQADPQHLLGAHCVSASPRSIHSARPPLLRSVPAREASAQPFLQGIWCVNPRAGPRLTLGAGL